MPTTTTSADNIERRTKLSPAAFAREYLRANRPVIITDALSGWPALGKWSPEFFREKFGTREVPVDGQKRSLGPLVDEVLASTRENPAPYLRNEPVRELFPELLADIDPLPPYVRPNWLNHGFSHPDTAYLNRAAEIEFYLGGAGRSFPVLHYDGLCTHAFLMQIYGRKQYFAYAPDQTPYMYPVETDPNRSQVNDVETPDLARFPLFAQARGFTFTLEPGEMLFIPYGWWHTVRMLTPSITVSVNVANASNWKMVARDLCKLTYRMHPSRQKIVKLGLYLGGVGARNRVKDLFGTGR